jgi:hypothetical protein
LDAHSEWHDQSDIVKLTLKGIQHILKSQHQAITQMRQAPYDLQTQLRAKANIEDVRRTMQEVASNMENRVTFTDLHQIISTETRRIIDEQVSGKLNSNTSPDLNGTSFEFELHKLKEATQLMQEQLNSVNSASHLPDMHSQFG